MMPPELDNDAPSQDYAVSMDSIVSAPSNGVPREDLINRATNFLLNPKVNRDSESEQRAFLQRKGLTPVEIDMAFQRRMTLMSSPAALSGLLHSPRSSDGWADFFHRFAMSVAVFSSASYALYWFFKTYVEPKLGQNRTEQYMAEMLQELRDMREERRQKAESDSEYALKTAKAIADLRDEMSSLKGMLLARNQFPASPTFTSISTKIPSWQQNHQASTSQVDDTKATQTRSEEEKSPEKEECAPDSGISPEATSSDGEPQDKEVKDKPRNSKKKRGAVC